MTRERRRLDVISDPAFLADIEELAPSELRRRRGLVGHVENELSYQRRLLHARLDMIAFERRRRQGEETRSLVEAIDEILADAELPARHQSATTHAEPLPSYEGPQRRSVDRILHDDFLARLPEIDDAALDESAAAIQAAATQTDTQRHAVHAVYDTLGAEISRRYRLGLTSIDELLQD